MVGFRVAFMALSISGRSVAYQATIPPTTITPYTVKVIPHLSSGRMIRQAQWLIAGLLTFEAVFLLDFALVFGDDFNFLAMFFYGIQTVRIGLRFLLFFEFLKKG